MERLELSWTIHCIQNRHEHLRENLCPPPKKKRYGKGWGCSSVVEIFFVYRHKTQGSISSTKQVNNQAPKTVMLELNHNKNSIMFVLHASLHLISRENTCWLFY